MSHCLQTDIHEVLHSLWSGRDTLSEIPIDHNIVLAGFLRWKFLPKRGVQLDGVSDMLELESDGELLASAVNLIVLECALTHQINPFVDILRQIRMDALQCFLLIGKYNRVVRDFDPIPSVLVCVDHFDGQLGFR